MRRASQAWLDLVRLAALRSPHVCEGEERERGAARAPLQAGGGALAELSMNSGMKMKAEIRVIHVVAGGPGRLEDDVDASL
jgi:hypothetical protein